MAAQRNPVEPVHERAGRLLRLDDVAGLLSVSRSMAWKLISAGEIRSVRIGRAVRVRPADLDAYLASPDRERPAA